MTNWLAIDTSMNACGVAVQRSDGEFFSSIEHMERGQAERLMPMIVDIVAQAGLALPDIGAYAVTNGPGTFTGLRVGLATARALAQVSGKPAIGVGTFDAIAAHINRDKLCILVETKRTDYYVRAPGRVDACLSPGELRAILQPDWIVAGDAVERARAETGFENETLPLTSVPLQGLIACAKAQPAAGLPEPVYLRGADVSVARKIPARIV